MVTILSVGLHVADADRAGALHLAVDVHGAGAALRDAAAVFGAGQADLLADDPQQRRVGLDLHVAILPLMLSFAIRTLPGIARRRRHSLLLGLCREAYGRAPEVPEVPPGSYEVFQFNARRAAYGKEASSLLPGVEGWQDRIHNTMLRVKPSSRGDHSRIGSPSTVQRRSSRRSSFGKSVRAWMVQRLSHIRKSPSCQTCS